MVKQCFYFTTAIVIIISKHTNSLKWGAFIFSCFVFWTIFQCFGHSGEKYSYCSLCYSFFLWNNSSFNMNSNTNSHPTMYSKLCTFSVLMTL